jgi:hypothetical protein
MSRLFFGRHLYKFKQEDMTGDTPNYTAIPEGAASPAEADLVTSLLREEFNTTTHAPVIDLDLPCRLVESGTPGHYHLYIDKAVLWPEYLAMLEAMANAGIVEPGYVRASEARGYSAVRVPWKPKGMSSCESAPTAPF